ncbi:glutathione-disulfide reductase [Altererythrobacter sp. CC-YST694]|uniref:glutathione-disulfide reductase n=1 Tax=Altererythrobacter sp. CC-YST694 TaxID=2755038 RepID=UPI001D007453|nr:glutathione-disulfide reductase [Altererythrobacter sp. CC-YST694]MCB5424692.1 glutathione-disulfide reductase [Altererythrobacter sp. CC-YST694]
MSDFDYDLFIIGAGSGGVRASRIASSHGARVAVAEEYRVGGTCVIRGCVPKKMLVYGSMFAEELSHAGNYGWTIEGKSFDWKVLRDFVNADVDRLEGLYGKTLENNRVEKYLERATVTGPNSVKLASGKEITAKYILVAVGGWPAMPDIPGVEHCISSNEVFHLEEQPKRLLVVGGGYIAMEFAGVFNALGSEVTVINRSETILRGYDRGVVERLSEIAQARGIQFKLNANIRSVTKQADGSLLADLGGETIEADQILIATGRKPNTAGLGLETAGIKLGVKGEVPVDQYNRTSCPSIYAVGDVTDRVQLTPVAIREGHAFADTVFGNKPRIVEYDHIPSAVFSQPPLAGVGLTEEQARREYPNVKVYKSDFRPMKNLFSPNAERGLYRMIVDEDTNKVLGIHMVGPEAPEILQVAAIAVKAGLTKADFDATVALHPSMAEELVLLN